MSLRSGESLFDSSKDPWRMLLAFDVPWLGNSERLWRFQGSLSCFGEDKRAVGAARALPVMNSVADWSRGRRVKVIGLGTRASSALQLCHESALLSSAELWISSGDAVNAQLFGLLNNNNAKVVDVSKLDGSLPFPGQVLQEVPNIVVLVIGMGASLCGKEALDILQSSRGHSSLSVMIVIQPFNFEGPRRKKEVEVLAGSLLEHTDLCFVFEHDALLKRERVTLTEALRIADNTVLYAIKAVSDLSLGDQVKVFDAPPEGLRDIASTEILSILGRAGNAWVGFGSSYSVKSAVQRAAFESPFLQGLIPGVKGLVACTIASAEEKGRKDLQAALHALRCTIGPRAQLVCTSVKEPTLRQGVILATILLTRIGSGGGHDVSKQCMTSPELSFPFSFFSGGSMGYSTSMNGRELRKSSLENPIESTESRLSGPTVQEASKPSSSSSPLNILNLGDVYDSSDILHDDAGDMQNDSQSSLGEEALEGNKAASKVVTVECSQTLKLSTTDSPEDIVIALSTPGSLQGLCSTDFSDAFDEGSSGNDFQISFPQAVENDDLKDRSSQGFRQQGSGLAAILDQVDMTERPVAPFNKEKPVVEKGDDSKWSFLSLPSILDRGNASVNDEKNGFFGWESGPYSAAAESWAQTRQRLGNLGALEKNGLYKLPIGVRSSDDPESDALMLGREQGRQWDSANQAALFDFAAPLSRVLSSGLEAVADLYNVASAKVFKKDENEETKQVSSFLSQRAASMLESERSSMKLPPMVEMNYKNGVYKGRCRGGLPEGKGRLSYADGSFYDGMWKQGKRAGIGSFYHANGDVFQGSWRDDQMHGKGWFYFHTGDRLYADFWKGKANGEGRYYSAKGDVFFGYFRESWRHGKSLSIESGVRWCEIWDHGVLVSRIRLEDMEQN